VKNKQTRAVVFGLAGGIFLLVLSVRCFRLGNPRMGLFAGACGIASLVLASQDFARLRRP